MNQDNTTQNQNPQPTQTSPSSPQPALQATPPQKPKTARWIVLGVIGGIMALAWPLAHFVIWPIISVFLTLFLTLLFILVPFMAVAVDTTWGDFIQRTFFDLLHSFPSGLNPILIIVTIVGVICLVIAIIQYSQTSKHSSIPPQKA